MKKLVILFGFVAFFIVPQIAGAADSAVSRRDGFLLIWKSIQRPAFESNEKPFSDVKEGSTGFVEITYAKARGIVDDDDASFYPDADLRLQQAILWLFRTRSIADIDDLTPETLADHLKRYPIAHLEGNEQTVVTEEELLALMRSLDAKLEEEVHEVSLYSEKFHGKGTAFGESFDMHAMTAAHRTFPHNTLVEVTNRDNGKVVTVRINDRGPYVEGRDMDLSLGSFLVLSPRSAGVLRNVTFKRLGDASLVLGCGQHSPLQQRITRDVRLLPGVPWRWELGQSVSWEATKPYVLRGITYPDGTSVKLQDWIFPNETYTFDPAIAGTYRFQFGTVEGRKREMQMTVIDCK